MRLWSIHPAYLDARGLVTLWREALLAKKVLEDKTKGYRNHPQLLRFKQHQASLHCINLYLKEIYYEAQRRGYNFDKTKIDWALPTASLPVTSGQINFEVKHLLNKLKIRDIYRYNTLTPVTDYNPHPLFNIIDGDIEAWEKL